MLPRRQRIKSREEEDGEGEEEEYSSPEFWPVAGSCFPVAGLTILAAGPIKFDDIGVVDLLQEVEF